MCFWNPSTAQSTPWKQISKVRVPWPTWLNITQPRYRNHRHKRNPLHHLLLCCRCQALVQAKERANLKKEKIVGGVRCMPVKVKEEWGLEGPLNWASWGGAIVPCGLEGSPVVETENGLYDGCREMERVDPGPHFEGLLSKTGSEISKKEQGLLDPHLILSHLLNEFCFDINNSRTR